MYIHGVLENKKLSYRRDSARRRSFKFTDFGTNRKPVYNFLLVINIKLHPVPYHFQAVEEKWSNFRFRLREHLSLTHSFRVNHKLTTMKFINKKPETSLYRVIENIFQYTERFKRGLRV